MKSELTKGIAIGVVLTIFGAVLQTFLIQYYENNKEIKKWDIITIKQLDNRLTKSNSILANSDTNFFLDRWSNYIYTAVYPWNENLFFIENHIRLHHNNAFNTFKDVENEFIVIHKHLNDLRKIRNNKQNKIILKKKIKKELKAIRVKIYSIKQEIIK